MIEKISSDLCCVTNSCKKIGLRLESFLDVKDECIEGFLSFKIPHYSRCSNLVGKFS
jgi:hypothetical protein